MYTYMYVFYVAGSGQTRLICMHTESHTSNPKIGHPSAALDVSVRACMLCYVTLRYVTLCYACMYVRMHALYIYIYTHTHIGIMCIYIYIYTCIYIYIYIYMRGPVEVSALLRGPGPHAHVREPDGLKGFLLAN